MISCSSAGADDKWVPAQGDALERILRRLNGAEFGVLLGQTYVLSPLVKVAGPVPAVTCDLLPHRARGWHGQLIACQGFGRVPYILGSTTRATTQRCLPILRSRVNPSFS